MGATSMVSPKTTAATMLPKIEEQQDEENRVSEARGATFSDDRSSVDKRQVYERASEVKDAAQANS